MRQKLSSITQSLRLPSICTLCNQYHKGRLAVCSFCFSLIKPLGPSCQHCAYPLPDTHHLICGRCIKKAPYIDRAFIPYIFEEPLRGLLHQFKYHKSLYLGSFLCRLMCQSFPEMTVKPHCLIPVPMHPQKLKQRGFNQSAVLTQLLAKKLNLPFDLRSCQKIIDTPSQAILDGDQRRKNVHKAFQVSSIPYKQVTLIDDLLTTGSTANELACTLKKSGVEQVDIWCCARAVYV